MKELFFTLLSLVILVNVNAQSKTYFLSPDGNDSNSGLSINTPWQTLEKINQFTFQPGDILLLKSGETWHGQMFPKGEGEVGNPIVISSYGGDKKPIIDIDDAEGAAIRLVNQSWWEIRNIEVTSGDKPKLGIGRQGIVALYEGDNAGIEHIVIEDCFIHDVWGQMGPNTKYNGYNSAAIYVGTILGSGESAQNSYYDDILIQNNRIERVDKCGIVVYYGRNDVLVKKNFLENLGGDAIFVNGPNQGMIEYNIAKRSCLRSGDMDLEGGEDFWPHTAAIWIQNTEGTIMQYNEVYHTGRQPRNGDGFAYDFDFDANNCILQYNYSQNNHGFLLIMNNTFGNITRYNISENDQTHLIQMQGSIDDQNIIHNNVFYVDYGTIDLDYFLRQPDREKIGAYFRNNIFYAHGQGRFRTAYTSGDPEVRNFDVTYKVPSSVAAQMFRNNCFYGTWLNGVPEDPERILEDPMFVAAGTGGEGLSTLGGYKLKPESPCINAGTPVAFVDHDFWGNPVNDGSIDIGPYEQIGSGVFGDPEAQEELNRTKKAELDILLTKMTFPESITVPEEGGEVSISLQNPISPAISGSIKINGENVRVRPESVEIDNTERNNFTFQFRPIDNLSASSSVSVTLEENGLEETFELPVYYSQKKTLESMETYQIDG
ncbi:MAG TPA: right-handed parallel beta-helix repeat-containing protein, partial [Draconibacterium sp.]|nr:right-handed parallel beta-helix repeat-containing protein [Draconibacterium sp.]